VSHHKTIVDANGVETTTSYTSTAQRTISESPVVTSHYSVKDSIIHDYETTKSIHHGIEDERHF
jgi:hypothetical protein